MGHTTSTNSAPSTGRRTSLMGETPSRKSAASRSESPSQKASKYQTPQTQDTTTNTFQGQGQSLTGIGSQFWGAGYDDGVYPDEIQIEPTDDHAPTK